MEQVQKDTILNRGNSSNNMSLKPQGPSIDDLSLTLTDIPETDERSINLDALEDTSRGNDDNEGSVGGSAFSDSANSSAHFSFTDETLGEQEGHYPAQYAPGKQAAYEEMKVVEERKARYGRLHMFGGVLDFLYGGMSSVYNSVSAYAKNVDLDRMCT